MADLFATLDRLGIHPGISEMREERYTEHRVTTTSVPEPAAADREKSSNVAKRNDIQLGDRIIVRYLDDNKTMSFVLSAERNDPVNGVIGATSPLGSQLLGCNEEDEVEFEAGGVVRRVLIMSARREQAALH